MSKLYLYCALGLISTTVQAQNIPNPGVIRRPATPVSTPAAYTNATVNYIRTWEPSAPMSDAPVVASPSRSVREVKQSTQYFDGLGRPLQTVGKGMSSYGYDIVTPVIYDEFGREQFKYLPYAAQESRDGKFKMDPFNAQQTFYRNGNQGGEGESIYYSQIDFEASPLNRILATYAAGNSWAKGNGHGVSQQYLVNTVADSVRIWQITASGYPTTSGIYPVGQLYKQVVTDENRSQVIEFKDKEGRVVLKKAQLKGVNGMGHMGWLCTYYVYDNIGNLRVVIPPLAVEKITDDWGASGVPMELCFRYTYDGRNRMISKEVPGAGPVEMVYDLRDRLVFTRDVNLYNQNRWLVTFYDNLNRPVETAWFASDIRRDELQRNMDYVSGGNGTTSYTVPRVANLVVAFNDRFLYEASNSITAENGFDSDGTELDMQINAGPSTDVINITVNNPLPNIPASMLTPLTYTFYDKYDFPGVQAAVTEDFTKPDATGSYFEPINKSNLTKGLVTGTRVRILDTDTWLTTTTYYNDKGRVSQIISDNVSGGKDIATTGYDFNGKVLSTYLRHKNIRSGVTPQTTVLTKMTYTDAGRLESVVKKFNDQDSLKRTIVFNHYDELGQLSRKQLGFKADYTSLEELSYGYNIRGWLRSINKEYLNGNSIFSHFGQELNYDYGFTDSTFNGNISGIRWKGWNDPKLRAYGYSYDSINRLVSANFSQQNTAGAAWTKDQMDFSTDGITYDANGNIKNMSQWGMDGWIKSQIDQLVYTYLPNSNKLAAVRDYSTVNSPLGDFKDGTNAGYDYEYDAMGNLIQDLNKSITSITYNHLNLPTAITIEGKGVIRYQYDAAGNKLKKTVTDNTRGTTKITTTDYINGFVYQNDTLQFASHEEGRLRLVHKNNQPPMYIYDYFVKDHLGNTRLVLTEKNDVNIYAATMEMPVAAKETALFSNVDNTRSAKPVGYPADESAGKNESVAKLTATGTGKKIGPSLVLRVMAGDTVQVRSKAFYKSNGPVNKNNSVVPAENMVADLVAAFGGSATADATHGAPVASNGTPFNTNFYNHDYRQLKEKNPDYPSNKPKAYLNYVLFDDQFKMVEENSGVKQVKAEPDQLQTLSQDKMGIKKSGFLYVYTSNESAQEVFFDNLMVVHDGGPVIEETHYYPFGLTMSGISSNALKGSNYPKNRKEYNGIEHTTDLDMNQYDAFFRTLDPQIGRWWQIDPKPDYMWSSYSAMSDNPISKMDFLGDTTRFGASLSQTLSYNGKQVKGIDLAKKTVKEWSKIGGVKLEINAKTGEVEFKGNARGRYSEKGREEIMSMVTGEGQTTIDFSTTKSSHSEGNNITLNPSEVESMVNGTSSDLNPVTSSFGMVALHEFRHTKVGGDFFHSERTMKTFGQIDIPDIVGNTIRQEMSIATGTNWGLRSSYTSVSINGINYIPYSFSTKVALEIAKYSEATLRGYMNAQVPKTEIIAISPQ